MNFQFFNLLFSILNSKIFLNFKQEFKNLLLSFSNLKELFLKNLA